MRECVQLCIVSVGYCDVDYTKSDICSQKDLVDKSIVPTQYRFYLPDFEHIITFM